MDEMLGDIMFLTRQKMEMTQDQYGAKYKISGPAIFKFEKGYVKPSLELWLKMAQDAQIPVRQAVLLWAKNKLPREYREYIELHDPKAASGTIERSKKAGGPLDYSKLENREQMRTAVSKDKTLPKALRELLDDDAMWALYKPTGHEINLLRDLFGPLGQGSKAGYGEALRLIREFAHSF